MAGGEVTVVELVKQFSEVTAVDGINLQMPAGEFFSMLGPSGSGKTTTLRMIAGFELPTAGRVLLDGQDVSRLPPYDRDVNTVFQDYALFPHMSVRENIEYGMRVRRVGRAERRERAEEALRSVRLEGYGARLVTSSPARKTFPDVGASKPAIMRSTVVLPDPDGPSIEKNSPSSMSRLRSSTALTWS